MLTGVKYIYINSCPSKYWNLYQEGKEDESLYDITFRNDSVYFLYYDTIETGQYYFTENRCKTFAKADKVISTKDFNSQYQLLLPSKTTSDSIVFKTDTLNIRKVQYYQNDSILYYDIQVTVYLNDEKIVDEIISTNGFSIYQKYEVYYSQTQNYYFVIGEFSFSERTRDDFYVFESLEHKSINKIGRIKKDNR